MAGTRNSAHLHDLHYLDHVRRESARFASVLSATASETRVPTCPGWNADDLLWHLSEVQWFWGTIVRDGVERGAAEEMKPPRPANRPGLEEFYQSASRELLTALANNPPETPAWTWADDKTVGFIRRRQAHEALIHRLDAELTAGDRSGLDPQLSADGVDEALRLIYGGDLPDWGKLDSDGSRTVRIEATDTGDSWFVTLGQFVGTDPDDGHSYDQAGVHVAVLAKGGDPLSTPASDDPGTHAAATIAGTAADLDCWLWHRPALDAIGRSGDTAVLAGFDAVIADGIN